ncbi:hypothetical protein [Nostoc sp. UIC 10630]|nr:hypothetical protein [Nostoc sp. UIC 10630]
MTEAVHERSPTMDERNHSVFLGEGYTSDRSYITHLSPIHRYS